MIRVKQVHIPCSYKYKDKSCSYSGDIENCDRTLADCIKHGNSQRYGGMNSIVCFDEMSEFTKEQSDYLINRKLK